MNLLCVGGSFKTMPIELREKLAFDGPKLPAALNELASRYGCESAIVSTCNRVEIYVARAGAPTAPDAELIAEFIAQFHDVRYDQIRASMYTRTNDAAAAHLFRVTSSLDSLIVGEGQIAGQVKKAYEAAHVAGSAGVVLHALFQQALAVAKRVRTQTGISHGHVSVSSVAVDYVRQVHHHFGDKTILVIGAGKMGVLTLKHLRELKPERILVANRSPEKAQAVAQECGGTAIAWEQLDDALVEADIVLSTTGAPEPIMPRRRFDAILARRSRGTMVILDIAVPRDFDPRIHDGDRACLFNVDDLKRIQEQTIQERQQHIQPAEAIIEQEVKRFLNDWRRKKNGPIIAQLTQEFERERQRIVTELFAKMNGKLSEEEKKHIEGAFKLLQNRFLHGPISVLAEDTPEPTQHNLLDALRKLFRLER
ncbi:MAG: glutamyl-tRNA reductase [Planctomycetes bacterium]|nr:glutamyl-tRNA reductase [Planctomycetota bacterium]